MTQNTLNDRIATDAGNAQVLKEFTQKTYDVSGNEYDYVISFFNKVMKDDVAAKNFTESIYQVAAATEIPVLSIVETLKGQDLMTLTASLAYYLNGIRSPSTLLGVKNIIKPNYFAGRNVLS